MIVDFHTHVIAPDEGAGFTDSKFLDKVLAGMKKMHAEMGDAYKPSALLEKLVADGKSFTR